jgi:REP element-mobilizing transposase RayT
MARPWRIEYEGALYHVFSRGNNQQDIFVTADDRYLFLDTIGQMSERFDIDIFAYVLMSNHYHLLLRTQKANLSACMQWFGTTYTRRFNLDHYQSGHRRLWEDVHHGFLYGSRKFVKRIKDRYMVSDPDPAIPQQKSVIRDSDPSELLSKASKILQCDLEGIIVSPRVRESDKLNRDILLYLLWQEGKYTNEKIGNILGLTHSAVSRRVSITKKKMAQDKDFRKRIKTIKSQIKP